MKILERLALALEPWKARLGRLVLYVVRIPYEMSTRAWHLLPADVLGLLLSIVLVWQYISY